MAKIPKKERVLLKNTIFDLYAKLGAAKSSKTVYKDIKELWSVLDIADSKKIRYNTPNACVVCVMRLLAMQYAVVALVVKCQKSNEEFLFSGLFSAVSNTIIAVMKLAEAGLDYQAMSQIRNLFELYMILAMVIESPEKRAAFVLAHESQDARKVWHQYFTKAKFSKMLKTFCATRSDLDKIAELSQTWIDENYGELSSFAHGDYVHIVCGSLSKENKDGLTNINLWGKYVSGQKNIYRQLFAVVWPTHMLLTYMLRDPAIDISEEHLFNSSSSPLRPLISELQGLILYLGEVAAAVYSNLKENALAGL